MKKPRVQAYLGLLTSQFIQFSIILLSSITRQLDFYLKVSQIFSLQQSALQPSALEPES